MRSRLLACLPARPAGRPTPSPSFPVYTRWPTTQRATRATCLARQPTRHHHPHSSAPLSPCSHLSFLPASRPCPPSCRACGEGSSGADRHRPSPSFGSVRVRAVRCATVQFSAAHLGTGQGALDILALVRHEPTCARWVRGRWAGGPNMLPCPAKYTASVHIEGGWRKSGRVRRRAGRTYRAK